jgi:hypothetical protein
MIRMKINAVFCFVMVTAALVSLPVCLSSWMDYHRMNIENVANTSCSDVSDEGSADPDHDEDNVCNSGKWHSCLIQNAVIISLPRIGLTGSARPPVWLPPKVS